MVDPGALFRFFDYRAKSSFRYPSVFIVGLIDRLIRGFSDFPINLLPFHQKLNGPFPLGSNVPVCPDSCLDYPFYFIRSLSNFFDGGAKTTLWKRDGVLSPSKSAKPQLLGIIIEGRRHYRSSDQALLQSGKAGVRRSPG